MHGFSRGVSLFSSYLVSSCIHELFLKRGGVCLLSYKGGELSFRGVIIFRGQVLNCFLYAYHVFLFGV
jgi:hypothetical protein